MSGEKSTEKAAYLEALARRAKTLIDANGSIADAARLTGIPANSISRLTRGENEPQIFMLAQFATGFGVSVEWLLTGQTPPAPPKDGWRADVATIPVLSAEVAAGVGRFEDYFEQVDEFPFPLAWLRKLNANPRSSHCVRVKNDGDSMLPTIAPRALLMVDTSKTDLHVRPLSARRKSPADIFVFHHRDGGARVKRIERLEGMAGFALISDNVLAYPVEIVGPNDGLTIFGKVVWWDNKL